MLDFEINFKSFGFKYSKEIEADFVFDVRCLPNPFYVDEFKEKTGLEKEVQDFILKSSEGEEYFKRLFDFLSFVVLLHKKEGKDGLTVAFGCTGGQHRSVTFAEIFAEHFKNKGFKCAVSHRDLEKR